MNQDELSVEVVDRRLQVDLDKEEGLTPKPTNEFMPAQGFEARGPAEEEGEEEGEEEEEEEE
jgi:hypothetical protein